MLASAFADSLLVYALPPPSLPPFNKHIIQAYKSVIALLIVLECFDGEVDAMTCYLGKAKHMGHWEVGRSTRQKDRYTEGLE